MDCAIITPLQEAGTLHHKDRQDFQIACPALSP